MATVNYIRIIEAAVRALARQRDEATKAHEQLRDETKAMLTWYVTDSTEACVDASIDGTRRGYLNALRHMVRSEGGVPSDTVLGVLREYWSFYEQMPTREEQLGERQTYIDALWEAIAYIGAHKGTQPVDGLLSTLVACIRIREGYRDGD